MSPKHSSLPGWGTYSGIRNGPILLPFSILPGQSPCSDGHWVSEHSQRSKHAKWGLANASCYLSTYDGDIIEGTHRSQGHSHFCTESFYPARFFFPGSCRTQSLLLTTTWWPFQGIQYHVTQRRLCQHWLGFAFLWFCSSIVLQIACPEWDDCVCVPCASKAEEEMSPHLFKTLQRFAWKHCKSWKLFSCILNSKSGMAAMLHGQVRVLALCQYHVRMRCEHGPASLLRLGF